MTDESKGPLQSGPILNFWWLIFIAATQVPFPHPSCPFLPKLYLQMLYLPLEKRLFHFSPGNACGFSPLCDAKRQVWNPFLYCNRYHALWFIFFTILSSIQWWDLLCRAGTTCLLFLVSLVMGSAMPSLNLTFIWRSDKYLYFPN